jgi:sugar (pentulose or hexulose) kinase
MFLGIDLGTSSLKALLIDGQDRILAQASTPLEVAKPTALVVGTRSACLVGRLSSIRARIAREFAP